MKTCSKCGESKALDAFGKRKNRAGEAVPQSRCKACINAACAASVAANPERRKAVLASYRDRHHEQVREAYRQWYYKDADQARAKKRSYDAANLEQARARRAKWRSENRAQIAQIGRSRRAAEGSYKAEDLKRIRAMQKNKCAHCAALLKQTGFHVDHIVPLALGGTNKAENIQLLCPPCNLRKGAKHPVDFAQQSGRLL